MPTNYRGKRLALFTICLAMLFSACSKKKHPEKYIPRDAAIVTTLDIQNMAVKVMDLNLLFDEHMFWNITPQVDQTNLVDTTGEIPIIESGLDFVSRFYLITGFSEGEVPSYMGLILPLADHRAFRKFAVSRSDQKMTVSPNNVHYTYLKRGGIMGWNKEVAVYLVAGERRLDATLEGELFRIFSLREDHMLVNYYPSFGELQQRSYDIGFWMNLKHLKHSPLPITRYLAQGTLEDGTYTGVVNFNDGSIDISTSLETSEKGEEVHVLKKSIDLEVWDHIAGEKISAAVCLGLNMQTIYDEFKADGIFTQANSYLSFLNITLEDLIGHLSGDISAILLDPKEEGEDHRFFVELGMKDQEVSDQIVNRLKELGVLSPDEDAYLLMNKFTLVEKSKKLLLTNDPDLKSTTFDPGSEATAFRTKAENNSLIFYLDFQSIPDYLLNQYGSQLQSFSLNVDQLESIQVLQGSLIDQKAVGSVKIQFLDKETNSLLQIVNYVKEISKAEDVGA